MPKARVNGHIFHYSIDDGYAVVRPEEGCNASTTEAMAKLVNSPLIASRNLIIDLSHTRYVETPGYRWLVRQVRDLEMDKRTLVVAGLPQTVERTFKLLKLDKCIPTALDVTSAIDMVTAPRREAVLV